MGKAVLCHHCPLTRHFWSVLKHLEAAAGRKTGSLQDVWAQSDSAVSLGLADNTAVELHHVGLLPACAGRLIRKRC